MDSAPAPYRNPDDRAPSIDVPKPKPRLVPLAMVWAVAVGIVGGYSCGLAVDRYGELGSLSLWLLGALAGYVGRKIITYASRPVGWSLVVACLAASVIAEVCWIHWNELECPEGWFAAVAS